MAKVPFWLGDRVASRATGQAGRVAEVRSTGVHITVGDDLVFVTWEDAERVEEEV